MMTAYLPPDPWEKMLNSMEMKVNGAVGCLRLKWRSEWSQVTAAMTEVTGNSNSHFNSDFLGK